MNENVEQDEQDLSNHVMSHYFKVNGNNEGANKHSYFLRAKPKTHRYDEVTMNKELGPSSSPTRSKSENLDDYSASSEEEDLANCLVMLSNKSSHHNATDDENKGKQLVEKGMFQCKACKKIFNSHQALGGHRASHKKVKGCFAAKLDGDVDEQDSAVQEEHDHPAIPAGSQPTRSAPAGKRPKMHECSVCRRVFSSGQALGGHKRCHWLTTSTDNAFIPSFQDFQYGHHPNVVDQQQQQQQQQQVCKEPMLITTNPPQQQQQDPHQQLDLNLNLLPVVNNTSCFDASTRFYLQQQKITSTGNKNDDDNNNGQTGCDQVNKIRKLSDLRDVNYDGGWLQMGIASTADINMY